MLEMSTKKMITSLLPYRSISIIGMEKNSGKTTTLNYILKNLKGIKIIGLTSIGRDGEDCDRVTNTHKPKIYVEKGTIVATAKNLLCKCDITKEILATTGISTPMGEIIIMRALSNGFVDIAGPSYNSALIKVRDLMLSFGCDLVLIDGALSRKGSAGNLVSEATILTTGASFSSNLIKVVEESSHNVKMLQLPKCSEKIEKVVRKILKIGKIGFIDSNFNMEVLDLPTSLNSYREIIDAVKLDYKYLVLGGAISKGLIESIIQNRELFKDFTIVIEDGTKIFIDSNTHHKLSMIPVRLEVLESINLLYLTCNPTSPYGYSFESKNFCELLKTTIDIDVIDIVGGEL